MSTQDDYKRWDDLEWVDKKQQADSHEGIDELREELTSRDEDVSREEQQGAGAKLPGVSRTTQKIPKTRTKGKKKKKK